MPPEDTGMVEKLGIRDAVGRPLATGAAVRSTGYETFFERTKTGTVVDARGGPPILAVVWDDDSRPFWHAVDLMWRCVDVRLDQSPPTDQTDPGGAE